MKTRIVLTIVLLTLLSMGVVNAASEPVEIGCTSVVTVLDGVLSEGEYADAVFVTLLYVAGDPDKAELGEVYAQYEGAGEVLAGYVVAYHPIVEDDNPEEYWIKLDGVTYILEVAFGEGVMEFIANGVPQGSFDFQFHANFLYDGEQQTGSHPEIPIEIGCPTGISIMLKNRAIGHPHQVAVYVEWHVIWQVGIAIFTVQRAENELGPYSDVATILGEPVFPATYHVIDYPIPQHGYPYWYRIQVYIPGLGTETEPPFLVKWQ